MGNYVYGTKGFNHRSSCFDEDQRLASLATWSGVGAGAEALSLQTQFLAMTPGGEQDIPGVTRIDNASALVGVYSSGVDLSELGLSFSMDVEGALDSIGSSWREVVDHIVASVPGLAISPDLSRSARYEFYRSDWPGLAKAIGHGVDVSQPDTLGKARDELWGAQPGYSIPLFAVNMLSHAITHDLDHMCVTDSQPGFKTNIWQVVESYASGDMACDANPSWADQVRYTYINKFLMYECMIDVAAESKRLLSERFDEALWMNLLLSYVEDEQWEELVGVTTEWLEHKDLNDAARLICLKLRGDAHMCQERFDEVLPDLKAAEAFGDTTLRAQYDWLISRS